MKLPFLGLGIVAAIICSCNSSTTSDSIGSSDSANMNNSAPAEAATTQIGPTNSPEATAAPANVDQPPAVIPQNPTPVAEGMNPAHGQPGHRCDISVGAPLSSAPPTPTPPNPSSPFPENIHPRHSRFRVVALGR